MYNPNQLYSTPVKIYGLDSRHTMQQSTSNQQESRYRTHQHLHKNNYLSAVVDTPSTMHTHKATNFNNRAEQIGKAAVLSTKECNGEG